MARFFSRDEEQRILDAIREAEAGSSGELRVHVQPRCRGDAYAEGRRVFARLGMTRTAQRNGVLFFLATRDRAFAVVGDEGIHAVVPAGFWQSTVDAMAARFAAGDFVGGLAAGIREAGRALRQYFPHQRNDVNELKDDIHYG